MLCAVIMAGGKGTRFWPLSTEEKPKQFLKLLGEDTMINMTIKRLLPLIPMERIFVVTAKQYVGLVKEELPELDENNIIIEPIGRNTAPCIALSAFYIRKRYEDATLVVVPSDHLIEEEDKFLNIVKSAEEFINNKNDAIVTVGITPSRPETAYGYIKTSLKAGEFKHNEVIKVERFVEKPNIDKAREYFKSGNYLWNSGVFISKVENIINLTSKHLENTHSILEEVALADECLYQDVLESKYKDVDNISMDFGIMEKADNIYMIPGSFGWDDIGNWGSIERYREKDENNNVISGNVTVINSKSNIIIGSKKPIIISGIEDIFFVESDEAIIITKKSEMEKIKELKENINLE